MTNLDSDNMTSESNIQTETSEMDNQLLASRNQLKESHERLIGVSKYCETEYINHKDDAMLAKNQLEKTKQYTTQSLASVAYQINTLATTFLSILQMQTAQLNMLETSINQVSQKVDLYQEKVARRDIGKLANKKTTTRNVCVRKIFQNELKNSNQAGNSLVDLNTRPHRYIRRGIDFNDFDGAGSGSYIKMKSMRLQQQNNRMSSGQNHSGIGSNSRSSIGQNMMPGNFSSQRSSGHPSGNFEGTSSNMSGLGAFPANRQHSSSGSSSNQMPLQYGTLGRNVKVPDVGPGRIVSGPGIGRKLETIPSPPGMPAENLPGPPVPVMTQNSVIMAPQNLPSPNLANIPPPQVQQVPNWPPANCLDTVKAIYDYTPDQEDELPLDEGDVIYVIVKNEDGWWEGYKTPELSGLFPSNYVESM